MIRKRIGHALAGDMASLVSCGALMAGLVSCVGACAFSIHELDIESPRVVSFSPVGTASTTTSLSVTFSRPVRRETVEVTNAFVLVRTEELTSVFRSDLGNPPLLASRQELVVPGRLVLSEDKTTLSFFPERPLEGQTGYSYLVSGSVTDKNDNPLVVPLLDEDGEIVRYPESHPRRPGEVVYVAGSFEATFVTERALDVEGPQVVERFPSPAAENVPMNLASAWVRFDGAVHNVSPGTFQVIGPEENEQDALERAGFVDITEGRTRAELLLTEDLDASTEYRVVLRSDIEDEAGGRLDELLNESFFVTAICRDEDPPKIHPDSIEVSPVDTFAIVRWVTNEPSVGIVHHGKAVPDMETDGGAAACEFLTYDPCTDPPMDAFCRHEVRIDGLDTETVYSFEVESIDAAGNRTITPGGEFKTLPLLPPLILNEIQPTPDVVPQSEAEFMEIFNAGEEAVDLLGWQVIDRSAPSPTKRELTAVDPWPHVLEPGEYALIVGQAFDASHYSDLTAQAILATGTTAAPLGGLTDSRGLYIEFLSPHGAVVSTFRGWFQGQDNRGVSIERIDPLGPDERDNWAWAEVPPGATPGYENSVTER